MTPDQKLFDEILTDALDILRLSAGERKKVEKKLAQMEKKIVTLLNEHDLSKKKKRELATILANANVTIAQTYAEVAAVIEVAPLALYVAENTSLALEIAMGIEATKLPRQFYFKSLAKNLIIQGSPQADWWRGQAADTAFKFAGQVRLGLAANETNQQIIQRIVGKEGQPGVMDAVRRNAAALVQTSVQSVANDARRETFKANGDIVKGIRQVSTLDSHTSLVCISYSGAEWNLDYEPINNNKLPFNSGCPRHFNCRSLEVAITKSFEEMGLKVKEPKSTRASDEGQIPVDTTMDGFLKRKGQSYQDNILGKGRAELWRAGKITLKDLVNNLGRPVTLSELNELAKKRKAR